MSKWEEIKKIKLSNKKKVLNFLLERGEKGATTDELKRINHRFSTGISDLKDEGIVIGKVDIGNQKHRYCYEGYSEKQKNERAIKPKDRVLSTLENHYAGASKILEEILIENNAIIKGKGK